MVAHRYAEGRRCATATTIRGRVVEQLNPAGLSYRYLYEQDRITVTDSLNRREVLHTEGGAGLKRVVKKNWRTAASRAAGMTRQEGSRRRRTRRDGGQSTV